VQYSVAPLTETPIRAADGADLTRKIGRAQRRRIRQGHPVFGIGWRLLERLSGLLSVLLFRLPVANNQFSRISRGHSQLERLLPLGFRREESNEKKASSIDTSENLYSDWVLKGTDQPCVARHRCGVVLRVPRPRTGDLCHCGGAHGPSCASSDEVAISFRTVRPGQSGSPPPVVEAAPTLGSRNRPVSPSSARRGGPVSDGATRTGARRDSSRCTTARKGRCLPGGRATAWLGRGRTIRRGSTR
jgi:hypothetical protein